MEIKLHSLKLKIGKILKANGYYASQTITYGRTRGYYYSRVRGNTDVKQSYLSYDTGSIKSASPMIIKSIYHLLVKEGLEEHLEPLDEDAEIIKFKNVI